MEDPFATPQSRFVSLQTEKKSLFVSFESDKGFLLSGLVAALRFHKLRPDFAFKTPALDFVPTFCTCSRLFFLQTLEGHGGRS